MTSEHTPGDTGHREASDPTPPGAPGRQQASGHHPSGQQQTSADDTSGIDNLLEEGGPLEPADVEAVEGDGSAEGAEAGNPLEEAHVRVAALTDDLQRLQAEYLNYKRRVDRDRDLIKENATYAALAPIVDVLDNIDRAREHGSLEDGFKAVAEQLERVVAAQGLVKFGEVGETFDPTVHEALSHLGAEEGIEATTVKVLAKAGYKIGDRVVRAAQVLVVDPA